MTAASLQSICEEDLDKILNDEQIYTKAIIEGLCAKRAYITFWVDFHFLQDRANFWQTDLLRREKHRFVIVFVGLCFVLQK